MRLAAIDIGTNSVHMIVVRVRPDFSFEVIDREKEMVRLGAGGLDGKKLTPEAMTAALQALSKFARLAASHQVDEILAVATSATREAENGGAFLRAIERRTGIRARIITGIEEARLIHLAAVYGVDTPKPAVVIDIGGGSVEITRGSGSKIALARSFKIGVIRLTERFVDSDPITQPRRTQDDGVHPRGSRSLSRAHRRTGLRPRDRHVRNDPVARHRGDGDGSRTACRRKSAIFASARRAIRRLRKTAVEMDLEERMHLPGLDPRRADLMVAGAVLLDTLLKKLGAEEITLCDLALREGVLLDYIHAHRKDIARVDSYPDVRRRSVIELAERCAWEAEHSKQVAAIALTLFDYTKRIHELGDREREWLEYAGLPARHRQSHQLREASSPLVLPDQERRPARLRAGRDRRDRAGHPLSPPRHAEARAHRLRPISDKEHRRTVTILSAFLRLAETLDRSRHGVMRGIEVRERLGEIRINVQAVGDAELEVWAAHKQARALEEALDRKVRIEKVPYRKASAPSVALVKNRPES